MNKELQDLAWSVLPKEFKEEVKNYYDNSSVLGVSAVLILENLFGVHNLTSDAEGEEMLMVSRKEVQELYNRYFGNPLEPVSKIRLRKDFQDLFGAKCLPDETPLSQNSPENCDSGNHISNDCDKSAEPKFKEGDITLSL